MRLGLFETDTVSDQKSDVTHRSITYQQIFGSRVRMLLYKSPYGITPACHIITDFVENNTSKCPYSRHLRDNKVSAKKKCQLFAEVIYREAGMAVTQSLVFLSNTVHVRFFEI